MSPKATFLFKRFRFKKFKFKEKKIGKIANFIVKMYILDFNIWE